MSLHVEVALWALAALITLLASWRRNLASSGLVLAYLVGFAQLHWLAVVLYLQPDYAFYDPALVQAGFEQSLAGITAFMIGSVLIAPQALRFVAGSRLSSSLTAQRGTGSGPLVPSVYLAFGAFCGALLITPLSQVPSSTSVLVSGAQFLVAGLCLQCWRAIRQRRYMQTLPWIAVTLALPLFTLVTQGFMSYGAAAATIVLAFVATLVRPRWILFAGGIAAGYVGLSLFVSYMQSRVQIRSVVWGERPFSERIEAVTGALDDFQWFDSANSTQAKLIDIRLNQNMLVGAAVRRLEGTNYFAHGETIVDGVRALVPRVIWPDKPMQAGSGRLVSEYTGINFAEGTSIGVGQVLESYINFGLTGVIVSFLILGTLVTTFDWMAGIALRRGNWTSFAFVFLVGACLLNIIGSLVETFSTMAATLIVATVLNRILLPALRPAHSQRRAARHRMHPVPAQEWDSDPSRAF